MFSIPETQYGIRGCASVMTRNKDAFHLVLFTLGRSNETDEITSVGLLRLPTITMTPDQAQGGGS